MGCAVRRFLNRLPDGVPPIQGHFAAEFSGVGELTNSNGDNSFSPAGGSNPQFSAWIRFDTIVPGTYYKVFHVGGGTTATDLYGVQLDGTSGLLEIYSSSGGSYSLTVGIAPTAGKWYFLVASWGGFAQNFELFDMSGVINTYTSGNNGINPAINQPAFLGGGEALANPLIGAIDSAIFWNAAPGISNVTLWNNGEALDYKQMPSSGLPHLVGFWQLDEASGSLVYKDSSGLNHPLSLVGHGITQVRGAGF